MSNFQNLVGKKFNKLTVIKYIGKTNDGHSFWECKCDCGKICKKNSRNLKSGNTKSCGCYKKICKKLNAKYNYSVNRSLYRCWGAMKNRCFNEMDKHYIYYGGRGIKVCDEWKDSFENFYNWSIANGYKEEKLPSGRNKWTIDRIGNNGNYCPENCRWVDKYVQSNNKRNNRFITYKNQTKTLAQWAREFGISSSALWYRLNNGLDMEKKKKIKKNKTKNEGEI